MPIPLSLYIHFPWCIRKCPYCDFNSHTLQNELPEQQYIDALLADLEQELPAIGNRPIQSIFMGGGTPSLFSPQAIERLLVSIQNRLHCHSQLEITLEANPGTFEQQRFQDYQKIGINRLSIGIQSFQNDKLKLLGRIHDGYEAQKAVEMIHQIGMKNFNLDLMFGLPQQTINDAIADLKMALSLHPTHLSWYQLTLEPNTYFHRFPPKLPANEIIDDMQEQGQLLLNTHGFAQYEISAYSLSHHQCKHNLNYWQFGDYLGIGAGAHSKLTHDNHKIVRFIKSKNPKDYLQSQQRIEEKIINSADLPLEFMMNVMRLNQPISLKLFTETTGLSSHIIDSSLKQGKNKGFLNFDENFIYLMPLGKNFLNDVLEIFMQS